MYKPLVMERTRPGIPVSATPTTSKPRVAAVPAAGHPTDAQNQQAVLPASNPAFVRAPAVVPGPSLSSGKPTNPSSKPPPGPRSSGQQQPAAAPARPTTSNGSHQSAPRPLSSLKMSVGIPAASKATASSRPSPVPSAASSPAVKELKKKRIDKTSLDTNPPVDEHPASLMASPEGSPPASHKAARTSSDAAAAPSGSKDAIEKRAADAVSKEVTDKQEKKREPLAILVVGEKKDVPLRQSPRRAKAKEASRPPVAPRKAKGGGPAAAPAHPVHKSAQNQQQPIQGSKKTTHGAASDGRTLPAAVGVKEPLILPPAIPQAASKSAMVDSGPNWLHPGTAPPGGGGGRASTPKTFRSKSALHHQHSVEKAKAPSEEPKGETSSLLPQVRYKY